jgi:hypothetical protein
MKPGSTGFVTSIIGVPPNQISPSKRAIFATSRPTTRLPGASTRPPPLCRGESERYGCTARCAVLAVASATAFAGAMCET